MSQPYDNQSQIFDQTLRWIDVLDDPERQDAKTRTAFFAWLAESPRHVEELSFALALSDEIASLPQEQRQQIATDPAGKGAESLAATVNVIPLARDTSGPSLRVVERADVGRPRPWRTLAIAASVFLFIGAAWLLTTVTFGWTAYETAIGEQRTLRLKDGSIAHLNAASRLEVRFTGDARELRLLDGEALFKVERDPSRPFRVHAGAAVIQAVGTQFNVHRRPSGTVVSVIEGIVNVNNGTADASPPARLGAGEQAKIAAGRVSKLAITDLAAVTAWRQHHLVFQNDVLADIAAEFNRYNSSPQLRIEGDTARNRRFAGTFDSDAPEELVEALRADRTLSIEQAGEQIIIRGR